MSTFPRQTEAQFASMLDKQVGRAYVLGAEANPSDPNPKAFDCSELVQWAWARSGNKIRDLAAWQYDDTIAVGDGPAKVGDLVFLRNNPARSNGIGHVAILTTRLANGDWRIIEARGRKWGVVRTTLSYWRTRGHFAGVRRQPGFSLLPNPGAVKVSYPPTLRKGSKGKWVVRLQKELNHGLTVDGLFGAKTEAKVRAWQKAHRLTADGIVGPKTWRSLGITA